MLAQGPEIHPTLNNTMHYSQQPPSPTAPHPIPIPIPVPILPFYENCFINILLVLHGTVLTFCTDYCRIIYRPISSIPLTYPHFFERSAPPFSLTMLRARPAWFPPHPMSSWPPCVADALARFWRLFRRGWAGFITAPVLGLGLVQSSNNIAHNAASSKTTGQEAPRVRLTDEGNPGLSGLLINATLTPGSKRQLEETSDGSNHQTSMCHEDNDDDEDRILSEIETGILDIFSDPYCNKHLLYGVIELLLVRLIPELAEKGIGELWEERLS
ncbi:hypothetical protein F5X96DRAFT_380824 [Biscogniauxia mediterranea]|nr:hypothetical protein F5X96DRAFT_380824 [Biscogniauxia mediterranea]